jgi:tetratricopeptide (TPR) repeat protein
MMSEAGRTQEALAAFDAALAALGPVVAEKASGPGDPPHSTRARAASSVHVSRGSLLLRLRRTDEAVASLERAARLAPADPVARQQKGEILLRAGRHAEAVAEFDAFDRLRPFHGGVRESRLLALHALGRISSVELAALATAAR